MTYKHQKTLQNEGKERALRKKKAGHAQVSVSLPLSKHSPGTPGVGVGYFWPGLVNWITSVPSFSSFFTATETLESPPMACASVCAEPCRVGEGEGERVIEFGLIAVLAASVALHFSPQHTARSLGMHPERGTLASPLYGCVVESGGVVYVYVLSREACWGVKLCWTKALHAASPLPRTPRRQPLGMN